MMFVLLEQILWRNIYSLTHVEVLILISQFCRGTLHCCLDCSSQLLYVQPVLLFFSESSVIPLSTVLSFMSIIVLFVMPFSSCVGWVHHSHDCGGAYKM
jgi:hypothetical protein